MHETNNRGRVDSGAWCGMCDFGDGGGVVNWIQVSIIVLCSLIFSAILLVQL